MPFCPKCGKSVGENDAFCINCGTALKSQPSTQPPQYQRSFKVRVRSKEYARLTGDWKQVEVNSLQQWEVLRESLFQDFRKRFGVIYLSKARFGLAKGTGVPRWNDVSWEIVKKTLVVDNENLVLEALRSIGT